MFRCFHGEMTATTLLLSYDFSFDDTSKPRSSYIHTENISSFWIQTVAICLKITRLLTARNGHKNDEKLQDKHSYTH